MTPKASFWLYALSVLVLTACGNSERDPNSNVGDAEDGAGGDAFDLGDTPTDATDGDVGVEDTDVSTAEDATDSSDTAEDTGEDIDDPVDVAEEVGQDALVDADASDADASDADAQGDAADDTATDADAACVDEDGDGRGVDCAAGSDCADDDTNNWTSCAICADADADDVWAGCDRYEDIDGPDCDDGDGFIFQEATTYPDSDYDTYGDADAAGDTTCMGTYPRAGLSLDDLDCDDGTPLAFPDGPEIPGDGFDNDCGDDGDAAVDDTTGIFVVEAANTYCLDANASGTRGCPLTDLQDAVDAAELAGTVVFIAEGDYDPVLTDVTLVGGFEVGEVGSDPPTWTSSDSAETRIIMTAVTQFGVRVGGTNVALVSLTVFGTALNALPGGFFAVYGDADHANLVIHNCVVDMSGESPLRAIQKYTPSGTGAWVITATTIDIVGENGSSMGLYGESNDWLLVDGLDLTMSSESVSPLTIKATGPVVLRNSVVYGVNAKDVGGYGVSMRSDESMLVTSINMHLETGFNNYGILSVGAAGSLTQSMDNHFTLVGDNTTISHYHQVAGLFEASHNDIIVTDSTATSQGFSVQGASRARLHNNLLMLSAAPTQLALDSNAPRLEVTANTFLFDGEAGLQADVLSQTAEWGVIANNLVGIQDATGAVPRFILGGAQLQVFNNLLFMRDGSLLAPSVTAVEELDGCEWTGCSQAADNQVRDEGEGPDGTGALPADSPAIDTGANLFDLPVGVGTIDGLPDIDGDPRPLDGPNPEGDGSEDSTAEWDIGADEY